MPTKYIDFHKTKHIDPSFEEAYGLYDDRTDTIYIHSGLEKQGLPSRRETLLHEQGHRKIFKAGVKAYFSELQEEAFCDLWAILHYPTSKLSGFERITKDQITQGKRWAEIKSKEAIIKNILRMVKVTPRHSLVTALL